MLGGDKFVTDWRTQSQANSFSFEEEVSGFNGPSLVLQYTGLLAHVLNSF